MTDEKRYSNWVKQAKPRPKSTEGLEVAARFQSRKNLSERCMEYEPISKHYFVDGKEVSEQEFRDAAATRNYPISF